ncbi:MAG: YbaK/EbsC family protein [Acidobacteriota bacterium]
MADLCDRIIEALEAAGVSFTLQRHAAVSSAAEAATTRGTALAEGTKAILFKVDHDFAIFAMNAERALHSAKIRRHLGVKRTRFASGEELFSMTGLRPGAVPPFGPPILPYPLYADPSVLERRELIFTAASREVSIRLTTADYRRVAQPEVFPFTR